MILTPTLASPPVFPEDIVLPHGADDFEAQKRLPVGERMEHDRECFDHPSCPSG